MAIRIEHVFKATAETLWSIVGIPDRVDWVPGVTACVYNGDVRRLTMPGAGEITERIIRVNDDTRQIEYSCIESAAPLDHHLAKIEIQPQGDQCLMIWTTEVEPAAYEPFIEESMQGCLTQIESLI